MRVAFFTMLEPLRLECSGIAAVSRATVQHGVFLKKSSLALSNLSVLSILDERRYSCVLSLRHT